MEDHVPVGSTAWTGASDYDGEYSERITQFRDCRDRLACINPRPPHWPTNRRPALPLPSTAISLSSCKRLLPLPPDER